MTVCFYASYSEDQKKISQKQIYRRVCVGIILLASQHISAQIFSYSKRKKWNGTFIGVRKKEETSKLDS